LDDWFDLGVEEEDNKIEFKVSKDTQQGYINNTKELYEF